MEDSKIIDLFWARDETAIQQIDSQYGKKLHTLAFRILNNREDAEESVSDSYLKAWENIPPQRPTYLYAFLASICRNLSLHKVVCLEPCGEAERTDRCPVRGNGAMYSRCPSGVGIGGQGNWTASGSLLRTASQGKPVDFPSRKRDVRHHENPGDFPETVLAWGLYL